MKRFARSAALAGAALVALVLAIAASATTARSDRSTAPTAGAAVTNYLTYVKGKRGKADPKKSKIYIGWVNQQGGQVVIGGLATAGAQLAVKYVNDQSRRRRRPSGRARPVLHQVERGGRHDLRSEARQRQADRRHRDGRRRHGSPVAPRDDPRAQAGRHRRRHHPGRRSVEDRRRPLRRRPAHPPAVRQLREERPQGEDRCGHLPERAGHRGVRTGDRGRPEGRRHRDQAVGYTQGQTDLTAPLTAAGATTADFIAPYGSASDCANQAKALKQLGITDSRKIMTAPLCLNSTGDRRARRLADLDVRDRLVALRRSDRQGHARLPGGDQAVQGGEERSGSVAHRRVRPAPDDRPVPQRGRRGQRGQHHAGDGSWRGRRRSRGRSRSGRRSSSAASTRTRRGSATTCSRRSRTRASSRSSGRPAGSGRPSSAETNDDSSIRRGRSTVRPRRLTLTRRRERDTPLPPARPRDRGDDRRHRGRHRRHLPGLRLHQPGGGRDRHARGLLVLGAPHR